MTVNLPEHLERYLRDAVASGRFASIDQAVTLAVGKLEQEALSHGEETSPPPLEGVKPHWEVAAEITADIPPEEWAKIPADSSEQLDHYIYGLPRRPSRP